MPGAFELAVKDFETAVDQIRHARVEMARRVGASHAAQAMHDASDPINTVARPGQNAVHVALDVFEVEFVRQRQCAFCPDGVDCRQLVARRFVMLEQGQHSLAIALQHDEVIGDERQWIVDFVSHPSRQQADRRQLFVLHQHRAHLVALGEIAKGGEHQRSAVLMAAAVGAMRQFAERNLDGEVAAVLASALDLLGASQIALVAMCAVGVEELSGLLPKVLGDQVARGSADDFVGAPAEHAFGSGIEESDVAVAIDDDDAVHGRFGEPAMCRFSELATASWATTSCVTSQKMPCTPTTSPSAV